MKMLSMYITVQYEFMLDLFFLSLPLLFLFDCRLLLRERLAWSRQVHRGRGILNITIMIIYHEPFLCLLF